MDKRTPIEAIEHVSRHHLREADLLDIAEIERDEERDDAIRLIVPAGRRIDVVWAMNGDTRLLAGGNLMGAWDISIDDVVLREGQAIFTIVPRWVENRQHLSGTG